MSGAEQGVKRSRIWDSARHLETCGKRPCAATPLGRIWGLLRDLGARCAALQKPTLPPWQKNMAHADEMDVRKEISRWKL